mmetsp:Transcript_21998/g.52798  ORF Transcript_21998/g.52798 Transcript_21998/m.52798 type:complete len:271 (-) Transcript_21998:351-1163(-)
MASGRAAPAVSTHSSRSRATTSGPALACLVLPTRALTGRATRALGLARQSASRGSTRPLGWLGRGACHAPRAPTWAVSRQSSAPAAPPGPPPKRLGPSRCSSALVHRLSPPVGSTLAVCFGPERARAGATMSLVRQGSPPPRAGRPTSGFRSTPEAFTRAASLSMVSPCAGGRSTPARPSPLCQTTGARSTAPRGTITLAASPPPARPTAGATLSTTRPASPASARTPPSGCKGDRALLTWTARPSPAPSARGRTGSPSPRGSSTLAGCN